MTFEEWIKGFEDRYTPEQLKMFKICWDHTVATKKVTHLLGSKLETERWHIDWINSVAHRLGE